MAPITLSRTFDHKTQTHTSTLRHVSLGAPHLPPLVLVHGTPWSSVPYHALALSLSTHFHTHLFDRPGFGCSPPESRVAGAPTPSTPREDYDADLARQAAAFAALCAHWASDPDEGWAGRAPHVVAHDNGCLVSLRGALVHGLRYASLCLLDAVAMGPFGKPLFASVARNPGAFEELPGMALDGILTAYISNAAFWPLPRETMEALKGPWLSEGGRRAFVRELCQANHRSTDEVEGRYREVGAKIPVKIVWGKEDRWIGFETAERLGRALGAKEVVVLEEAGHLVMYDQPARLGVELGTWLVRVEAGLV